MRYIIIGDIHGCYEELVELFKVVELQPEDKVVSIGDIIHKGPNEIECIKLIAYNSDDYVLGNHEEKQLRWEKHEERSDKKNPIKNADDYIRLSKVTFDDSSTTLKSWLKDSAVLFKQLEVNKKKYILIHGGIPRNLKKLPESNHPWSYDDRDRKFYFNMLRTRFETPDGKMVMLGEEGPNDNYWADLYDGRFGYAIFGHQPFIHNTEPKFFKNAVGIDLGCVYGNVLCAFVIHDSGKEEWVTVPAKKQYSIPRSND